MDWLALQNGSDIRGIAMPEPGVATAEAVNLTPAVLQRLGHAFAQWLAEQKGCAPEMLRLAIGRDSRLTGPDLARAFMQGVVATGAAIEDFGLASTPAMFMATVTPGFAVDGAVMLTASHLPRHRNGCKFFAAHGGLDKSAIRQLLDMAARATPRQWSEQHDGPSTDFMSVYAAHLVDLIRQRIADPEQPLQPLAGLQIVVDASHGAGGFFVEQVLHPLGAQTQGSFGLEPDGNFPGHVPNPEDASALAELQQAVLQQHADLGIIFDPDVDRAAAVDQAGQPIHRNRLVALAAAMVLRDHPGSTIVTDSITSDGLTAFIETTLGGRHHRFRRGYRNVINEARRLNAAGEACWLAIETSGHAALRDNHFLDDGAYLMALLLVELALARRQNRSLADLTRELREPVEDGEFRLPISAQPSAAFGEQVLERLRDWVAQQADWRIVPNTHEGLRVACTSAAEQGWFLLRLSLHDPVMVLNIESERHGGLALIRQRLQVFFTQKAGAELVTEQL